MTQRKGTNNYPFRSALFLVVLMAGIFSIIGSGGGSGDGDDNGGSDSYGLLPLYHLRITGVDDPLDSWETGLTVEFTEDSTTHEMRIDPQALDGGFRCNTSTEECELSSLEVTTQVAVYDLSSSLFGDFQINITDQLLFVTEDAPADGTLKIAQNPGFGAVTVDVTTCSGELAGVEILDNGSSRGCFTWDQLDGLLDSSSQVSEQVAGLAYGILEYLLELSDIAVLTSFDLMDQDLASVGNVAVHCDSFSSAGVSPPTLFSAWDLGNALFHFVDEDADLEQSPGDSYGFMFNVCWQNDPNDDIDKLYNGLIDLISLTKVVDSSDTLTRIGYEGTTNGKTGGVFFDYFAIYETQSDTLTTSSSITSQTQLNGGMSVVFSTP
ncbi:MAG: hypothetical protein P8171_17685 [Candidatus Thiodiazotropha sp.]